MSCFMLVRHKVRDFKSWKAGYDAHQPKRVEAGLTEKYLTLCLINMKPLTILSLRCVRQQTKTVEALLTNA